MPFSASRSCILFAGSCLQKTKLPVSVCEKKIRPKKNMSEDMLSDCSFMAAKKHMSTKINLSVSGSVAVARPPPAKRKKGDGVDDLLFFFFFLVFFCTTGDRVDDLPAVRRPAYLLRHFHLVFFPPFFFSSFLFFFF